MYALLNWTIGLLIATLLITSCSQRSGNETRNGTGVQMGGVDSSGGETPRSSHAQVEEAVARQLPRLSVAFHRMSVFLNEKIEPKNTSAEETTRGFADESTFVVFNDESRALLSRLFPQGDPAELFRKIRTMKVAFQEPACPGEFTKPGQNNDPRDMSIKADGSVCASYERLRGHAPENLDFQILALLSMEASHLMGFDRSEATKVRDWFRAHPSIVQPTDKDILEIRRAMLAILNLQSEIGLVSNNGLENSHCRDIALVLGQRTVVPVLVHIEIANLCRSRDIGRLEDRMLAAYNSFLSYVDPDEPKIHHSRTPVAERFFTGREAADRLSADERASCAVSPALDPKLGEIVMTSENLAGRVEVRARFKPAGERKIHLRLRETENAFLYSERDFGRGGQVQNGVIGFFDGLTPMQLTAEISLTETDLLGGQAGESELQTLEIRCELHSGHAAN